MPKREHTESTGAHGSRTQSTAQAVNGALQEMNPKEPRRTILDT